MTTTPAPVQSLLDSARKGGWTVLVRNLNERPNGQPSPQSWIVEITRTFQPNDRDAYLDADIEAYGVLRQVPTSYPGSTWGTTSDGVGGHAGLTGGYYRLAKSGVQATFAKQLKKALG